MAATLCNLLASTSVPTAEYSVVGSSAKLVKYVKNNISASAAPAVSDDNTQGYAIFSVWIDTTNDNVYQCVDASTGAAVWKQLDGAAGSVDASAVTYTPNDVNDWTGATDPGNVDDALDQLALRTTDIEQPAWVTYARIQDLPACSVLGRSANSTGVSADIPSISDNELLVRRSGSLGFGTLVATDIPAHAASHISGGSDAFTSGQLLEAVVKRLRESGSSTDLTMGTVGDGTFFQRSGTSIIGANAVEDLETEVYWLLSGSKLYAYSSADLEPRRIDIQNIMPRGHIDGLTLSNNSTDPTNDIDIAAGCAGWAGADYLPLGGWFAGMTKRLDATFSAGTGNGMLDTGSIADGWYHIFLIGKTTAADTDILASTSFASPTMPSGWDLKRRIASIYRTGGAIKTFFQSGDLFLWLSPVEDVAVTNLGSSASSYTMTVPTGLVVEGLFSGYALTAGENWYGSSLNITNEALSNSGPTRVTARANDSRVPLMSLLTNTSAQIRLRGNVANTDANVTTRGWIDPRGRNA